MSRAEDLVGGLLAAVRRTIDERGVTYDEYRAAKQWLIDVGQAGEWPLLLDVFVESAVEEQAFAARPGTAGAIEGPYYLPGAPRCTDRLPMRPGEEGEPLWVAGRVTSSGGEPLPGALLDVWQADARGRYSGFDAGVPAGNLRGTFATDGEGRFRFRTVKPAPYTIPHDGPVGRMIRACGWEPWRPAHLHLKLGAEGHELVTTQLTFADSPWLEEDVARAVKPSLLVTPQRRADALVLEHDFALAPLGRPARADAGRRGPRSWRPPAAATRPRY